jgi:ADP-heptose:LPS heptosyltransferase
MPAYLFAEPSLLEKWRERMNGLGPGLKVGISWRGGAEANVRRARSTTLDQWRGVLAVPGARFVSLQYGDTQSELDACYRGTGIEISDWEDADPLGDLDEFAAQIAALDLVVSVDNSTVHIAGALGLPVWTLLPFASDWRWLHGREDSVWYPTMRLFRQTAPRNWNDVFKSVVAKLTSRVQENGTRIQV